MPELTHAALTNIESGRRKEGKRRRTITIDEVAVLALALRVPPLALLSPYPDSRKASVSPTFSEVPSYLMFTWFVGDELLPHYHYLEGPEEFDHIHDDYFAASAPIAEIRFHAQMVGFRSDAGEELLQTIDEISKTEPGSQEHALAIARRDSQLEEIQQLDETIVEIRTRMTSEGWPPPLLPPAIDYLDEKTSEDYSKKSHRLHGTYLDSILAGERRQEETNKRMAREFAEGQKA